MPHRLLTSASLFSAIVAVLTAGSWDGTTTVRFAAATLSVGSGDMPAAGEVAAPIPPPPRLRYLHHRPVGNDDKPSGFHHHNYPFGDSVPLNSAPPLQDGPAVKDIFLGIFMQPPAYGGSCATIRDIYRGEEVMEKVESPFLAPSKQPLPQVTLPPNSNTTGCVSSYYVRWAEQAGMRVVPLPFDSTEEELVWLMDRVNGVLFTGGIIMDDEPVVDAYLKQARIIFNYSVNKYNHPDPRQREVFPLWGTCQGFEILHLIAADRPNEVLQKNFTGMNPLMLPLKFLRGTLNNPNVTLFANAPMNVVDALATKNTTLNFHTKGISPLVYDPTAAAGVFDAGVADTFKPLAYSLDTSGQPFVAAVEGRNAPIFAVQFHPEKPAYDFTSPKVAHDFASLSVATYFAFFLRMQLDRNNHAFASREEGNKYVIQNYPYANMGYGLQYYFV